jgi:hypothetical protein
MYPAYSPNVLAVGGTTLSLDYWGNVMEECGWSGSGGGLSQYEPEPAYQWGVQDAGVRTVPDVAYDADSNTGFWIYDTAGVSGWTSLGGTSAGAPQWAALIALVDQERATVWGAGSLDGATQTLPALYSPQMSQNFRDITTGNNGYDATPGYDLVTGLGSPWAPGLVHDLAAVGTGSPHSRKASLRVAMISVVAPSLPKEGPLGRSSQVSAALGVHRAVDRVFTESSLSVAETRDPEYLLLPAAAADRSAIAEAHHMPTIGLSQSKFWSLWQPTLPGFEDFFLDAWIETEIAL